MEAGIYFVCSLVFVLMGGESLFMRRPGLSEHLLILLLTLPGFWTAWFSGQMLFRPDRTAAWVRAMPARRQILYREVGRPVLILG